jgi:hypothetical protein
VGRHSSSRFTLTAIVSGAAALVVLGAAAGSGERSATLSRGASSCGATVKVTDHATYVVNRYLQDAMRYVPGSTTIRSGCDLTFEFATLGQNDPHSLSVVRKADLPRTDAQMEACPICKDIKSLHVGDPTLPAGPKNPILHWTVNVGRPGLDAPGDSLALFEATKKGAPPGHQKVTVRVSAPSGTTLYFMCGMHPWMQGKIVVT